MEPLTTQAPPSPDVATSPPKRLVPHWIVLLRHLVGMAAISALLHVATFRGFSALEWSFKFIVLVGFALLATFLWALFFTARSKGHFAGNFVRLAWVAIGLFGLGEYTTVAEKIFVPSAAVETRKNEGKIAYLRRQPEFAGLSDGAIVVSIQLEYPDTPIEEVAATLGVPLTPALKQIADERRKTGLLSVQHDPDRTTGTWATD